MLAVDGGEPQHRQASARTRRGITVLSVERERATIEFDGKQRVLALGQHYRTARTAAGDRQSVTLAADPRGHFVADGQINGGPVRFLVDTGASARRAAGGRRAAPGHRLPQGRARHDADRRRRRRRCTA